MTRFVAGVSMVFLLFEVGSRSAPRPQGLSARETARSLSFDTTRKTADTFVRASRYREAAALYDRLYRQALEEGNPALAIQMLNNLAGMRQLLFSYQEALRAYLTAKQISTQSGWVEIIPVLDANISTMYGSMGDFSQGIQLGEKALPQLTGKLRIHRTALLTNLAVAYWRKHDIQKAKEYLEEAAGEAERSGDSRMQAMALDRLGDIALDSGPAAAAEAYYFAAFRIRHLFRPADLYLSYPRIAKVSAALARKRDANRFFELALAAHRTDSKSFPHYSILTSRGDLRARSGDIGGALADYRAALTAVRNQRMDLLPIGEMQASWEGSIQGLRSSFIRLAAEQALLTQDSGLALESLVAAEESRLASIRSSDGMPKWQAKLPAEYWERLAALQRAESSTAAGTPEVGQLRLQLLELEGRAGLAAEWVTLPSDPLRLAAVVRDDVAHNAAIISFHLDEPSSYAWFITRGRVDLVRLPGRKAITQSISTFRAALERDSEDAATAGRTVYTQIFGEIPPAAATKRFWTIVSDDRLFELPFAALPAGSFPGAPYLVERHAIREAPSALLRSPQGPRQPGLFVGIGDPIYNAADDRVRSMAGTPSLELPRLLSSATEVDRCARAWTGTTRVLKGSDINLGAAVQQSPAALHFATHFVRSAENQERAMIALGLMGPSFQPQLVGADQISAMSLSGGLVSMSGCDSGAGETIPGAGLMGLTRSWLIAGANAVTGTYWPTPDDSGELFVRFYEAYSRQEAPEVEAASLALQEAQIAMIRTAGWRRSPRYWGAYFLMTKG